MAENKDTVSEGLRNKIRNSVTPSDKDGTEFKLGKGAKEAKADAGAKSLEIDKKDPRPQWQIEADKQKAKDKLNLSLTDKKDAKDKLPEGYGQAPAIGKSKGVPVQETELGKDSGVYLGDKKIGGKFGDFLYNISKSPVADETIALGDAARREEAARKELEELENEESSNNLIRNTNNNSFISDTTKPSPAPSEELKAEPATKGPNIMELLNTPREPLAPWLNKEKPNTNTNDSNVDYENMFADVDDSDVNLGADIENSSNNTGVTTNPAIPTEPGYNNDAVKDRAETEYRMAQDNNVIGISEDPNKTNYVNDDWNQGMVEESTDVVSDERCKKFMSSVVKHEPAMRNGFKKIVTIIRK